MDNLKRSIAGIRTDLKMNQFEMAEKLGVSISTYQRYERNETPIPVEIAIKIADMAKVEDLRTIKFY